jgi:hypothetical protein
MEGEQQRNISPPLCTFGVDERELGDPVGGHGLLGVVRQPTGQRRLAFERRADPIHGPAPLVPAPAPRTCPTSPALQRETLEEGGIEGEAPRVGVAGRPGRSLQWGRLLLWRRRGEVRNGRGVVGEGGEVEVGEGEVAVGVEEEVRVGEAQERLRVGPPMMPPASAARGRGRQRESRVHVGRRRRLRSSLTAAVLGGGSWVWICVRVLSPPAGGNTVPIHPTGNTVPIHPTRLFLIVWLRSAEMYSMVVILFTVIQ